MFSAFNFVLYVVSCLCSLPVVVFVTFVVVLSLLLRPNCVQVFTVPMFIVSVKRPK